MDYPRLPLWVLDLMGNRTMLIATKEPYFAGAKFGKLPAWPMGTQGDGTSIHVPPSHVAVLAAFRNARSFAIWTGWGFDEDHHGWTGRLKGLCPTVRFSRNFRIDGHRHVHFHHPDDILYLKMVLS